ncbi:MAG: flagellar basal body-associated protein FliL [Arenibacterium sp.]
MTDAATEPTEEMPKSGKKPLLIGLVLAVIGAGGGFFAVSSGMLPLGAKPEMEAMSKDSKEEVVTIEKNPSDMADVAFVPIEPIIVSLNHQTAVTHLRFRASLEVDSASVQEVEQLLPRVSDVLNSYLRAIDTKDFSDSLALMRLRAQMLRRIQIVIGQGRVRDLLIQEFVLN